MYFWHERHTCYQLSYIGVALGYGGYGSLNMNNLVRFKGTLQMFAGNCRDFAGKSECRDFKFMGIACIPTIPVILKSPHSDFNIKIAGILTLQGYYGDTPH